MPSTIEPLSQNGRPPCSLPLHDADLSLGNANWMKGLQSMSDWIWSGNLNPQPFPNHLARFFLQIPGIFEQQLNFSTTLIFDLPSFRNGIQVSGFLNRITRELVISLIAQRRHCWYSMTHHSVLGFLTARQQGASESDFAAKLVNVLNHANRPDLYTPVEREVLQFADAFATNPKLYSDAQYMNLRKALKEDNLSRFADEGQWMEKLNAARTARASALMSGGSLEEALETAKKAASQFKDGMSKELNERKTDAQIVELAFLCLQFVALSGVFTALNIPDESFLSGVMQAILPDSVIRRINELNELGKENLPSLVPPSHEVPLEAILDGSVSVEPAPLKGTRIPLETYETKMDKDLDKGLTVGGAQVGVYGWSFGFHFPGSLVYALMLHPELARFEPPYSLPLLFNEDEWRNGTQTGGFVSRLLKEIVYQKIYKTTRSRYGLEHHTMFLYNTYMDLYGVGRGPKPDMTAAQAQSARKLALQKAENAILYINDHENAPEGVFSELEKATMTWVHRFITEPHTAHQVEGSVRAALDKENRAEVTAGVRHLDASPGLGTEAAYSRLQDHQIAELAMLTGHMDGLGRALTILHLESEDPVLSVKGELDPKTGKIKPELDSNKQITPTGYFNTRPGLLDFLRMLGVSDRALTMNELVLNPILNEDVKKQLGSRKKKTSIKVDAKTAAKTGEF